MSEFLPNSGDQFEVLASTARDTEASRAMDVIQTEFRTGYNDYFHNIDHEIRKRLGFKVLASLDYVNSEKPEPDVDFKHNTQMIRLPVKPIVSGFEITMVADRDSDYPPIPIYQPDTKLPLIHGSNYSPKIGIFLNQPLFLKGRFFVLNPDGYIQRAVMQLVVAQSMESPPLGEAWVGRKWLNLPNGPEVSRTEALELAIPA